MQPETLEGGEASHAPNMGIERAFLNPAARPRPPVESIGAPGRGSGACYTAAVRLPRMPGW
jgi:hypothetical protein